MTTMRFLCLALALASMPARGDITANGQVKNAQLELQSSDPTGKDGRIYYNTSTDLFKWYDLTSTTWRVAVDTTTAQTLTNKTMGSTNVLTGATAASFTNTGTVTLFTATDTVVGKATTDVLTNKHFDGGTASNTSKLEVPEANKSVLDALTRDQSALVYASDEDKLYVDDGSSLVEVGSGSGSSGVNNQITNGNAEQTAVPAAWTTYDDGASAAAVNGTGGSPAQVTAIARDTTAGNLVYGAGVWKMAKAAADGQGEGWAYDFTLPPKSQLYSSLVTLSFDYYMSTAAVSDVIRVYLYDRDNATLITPSFVTCGGGSTPTLASTTTACHAELAWVSTTADDYRLIFHVASSSATAVDLYVDNLFIGDYKAAIGASVGSWVAYTPTGSWVSNSTYTGYYRRVGSDLEAIVKIVLAGAPTSASLTVNLPSGLTIDTATLLYTYKGSPLGHGTYRDVGTSSYVGVVGYNSTTSVAAQVIDSSGTNATITSDVTATVPHTWANTDEVHLYFKAPISEWAGGTAFGENKVEYACSSTGTWNAAATTADTIHGPAGCPITGSLSASRNKAILWRTPHGTDEVVDIYIKYVGAPWVNINSIFPYAVQNTISCGMQAVAASSTTMNVTFSQYQVCGGATFGAAGFNWDNGSSWVAVKHKAGIPIGFGLATTTLPGLVKSNSVTTKKLTANSTGTGSAVDITDLTFTGLTVGAWYRLGGMIFYQMTADGTSCDVAFHNGNNNSDAVFGASGGAIDTGTTVAEHNQKPGVNAIFQALETSISVYQTSTLTSCTIRGNDTLSQTFLQLEYLGNMGS